MHVFARMFCSEVPRSVGDVQDPKDTPQERSSPQGSSATVSRRQGRVDPATCP